MNATTAGRVHEFRYARHQNGTWRGKCRCGALQIEGSPSRRDLLERHRLHVKWAGKRDA